MEEGDFESRPDETRSNLELWLVLPGMTHFCKSGESPHMIARRPTTIFPSPVARVIH